MYALSFDMEVGTLQNKYDEIKVMMESLGFTWAQGSLYIAKNEINNLTAVYKIINKLSKVRWFSESVRDIRAFKVEDWSDFTDIVKGI